MSLFIGSIAFALIISFLCSLSEATVLSLTPGEVAKLREKRPKIGNIWHGFKKSVDRPIVVILVLNTVAHTIGATVAGAEFEKIWQGQGILWFSLVFTLAILIFTEIVPKTMGVEHRRRLALWLAIPLNALIYILSPVIIAARWISRPFTGAKNSEKTLATDELRALAAYARLSKEIGAYQEKIITEASQLSEKNARDIMIPAEEIIYFSAEQGLEELIVKAHLDPHTRFPIVVNNDTDKIQGYVNFKELLFLSKSNPQNPSLEGIIRPIRFVLPQMRLPALLRVFIEEHIHISIVQDKDGKTLGLLTLEDIIEEFLGEIEDEFDRLPKMMHPLSGGTWMVGGGIYWRELSQHLPKLKAFAGTLSDWLIGQKGETPKTGDVITQQGLDFIIRRLRRGKIFEVTILPHGATPPPHLPITSQVKPYSPDPIL